MSWTARPSARMVTGPNSGSSIGIALHPIDDARAARVGTGRGQRVQPRQHGGIDARVVHRRHRAAGPLGEAAAPPAGRVVQVPVEGFRQQQALRRFEAKAVDVGQEDQQTRQRAAVAENAELTRLLDRGDGVVAGIGETDDAGARSLRLEQEGGEIRRAEGMPDAAQDFAAARLDDGRGVALQRLAEGVVGGQEEPALAPALDDGRCRSRAPAPRCRRSTARWSERISARSGLMTRRWSRGRPGPLPA